MGFDPALRIFGGMALGVLLEGEGGMCSDEDMVVRQYRGAYASVDSTSSGTGRKNSRSSYGPRPAPVRHSGPRAPRPLTSLTDRLAKCLARAPLNGYIVTFIFCWGRNFDDFYESLIGDNQNRMQGDAVIARTLYSVHIFWHSLVYDWPLLSCHTG